MAMFQQYIWVAHTTAIFLGSSRFLHTQLYLYKYIVWAYIFLLSLSYTHLILYLLFSSLYPLCLIYILPLIFLSFSFCFLRCMLLSIFPLFHISCFSPSTPLPFSLTPVYLSLSYWSLFPFILCHYFISKSLASYLPS